MTVTGIGRAIALALAAAGAHTFVLSKTQENLDSLVAQVLKRYENLAYVLYTLVPYGYRFEINW